ncbi:MAG: DUF6377 domain-containing protein [Bacteroidales bacterium]
MKQLLILLILISTQFAIIAQNSVSEKDFIELEKELQRVSVYDQMRINRITSLKKQLRDCDTGLDEINTTLKIGREYEAFITDSSIVYYNKCIFLSKTVNDTTKLLESYLGRLRVLGVSGFFTEAVDELNNIERYNIPQALRIQWLDAARQLYSFLLVYTDNENQYSQKYRHLLEKYRVDLLSELDHTTDLYKLFVVEHHIEVGDITIAKIELMNLIESITPESDVYARATNILATIYQQEGHEKVGAYYLIQSAICDIKGANKENRSLQDLAIYLYEQGEAERAYKFITASMEDAMLCNARLRTMQISRNIPLIAGAYSKKIENQQRMLLLTVIVVSILSICLIIAIILSIRQMRKLNIARLQLNEANSIKEEYMGRFLDLCSIYMERLDNFSKMVSRKASAGQIEDLIKLTKSSKFSEEQHKKFYDNFDHTFLHIYPTFVEEFNRLLYPEEQIIIKEEGQLTPELRIFAFLRMGVDDSNKIAGFLHFSVNTIYSYRNKMRNRAISRETFDDDVMNIGHFK